MNDRFAISDHHLRHSNIYRFTDTEGNLIRPWAKDAEEADELMIDAWNSVVGKGATVYHLGDVSISRKGLHLLERMNGRKILIRGNHDIFKLKDYTAHFADIRGSMKIDNLFFQHYPVHPDSIARWCLANVHGHTHGNTVTRINEHGDRVPDTRYFNLCIEAIGLVPLSIEEIQSRIIQAQENDPWA